MKKNVFICHRPYHILRSCDIMSRTNSDNTINILVVFDVITAHNHTRQRFETNRIFYSSFNEVIEIERDVLPSTRRPISYFRFVEEKQRYFYNTLQKHLDADSVYFYCDDELEIEIMVHLFKKYGNHALKRILVDEGLVTYSDTNHRLTIWGKIYARCLFRLMGFDGMNWKRSYGGSSLYNYSLANNPKMASFKPPIGKLMPLQDNVCAKFRSMLKCGHDIDETRPYFLYITTYLVPFDKEKGIIKKIIEILEKYNIQFYIKHHPQQNVEPFKSYISNSSILDKGYPVELFFSSKAIIAGVGSSSLVNASLLGYQVIDMGPMYDVNNSFSLKYDWLQIPSVDTINDFALKIQDIIRKLK